MQELCREINIYTIKKTSQTLLLGTDISLYDIIYCIYIKTSNVLKELSIILLICVDLIPLSINCKMNKQRKTEINLEANFGTSVYSHQRCHKFMNRL